MDCTGFVPRNGTPWAGMKCKACGVKKKDHGGGAHGQSSSKYMATAKDPVEVKLSEKAAWIEDSQAPFCQDSKLSEESSILQAKESKLSPALTVLKSHLELLNEDFSPEEVTSVVENLDACGIRTYRALQHFAREDLNGILLPGHAALVSEHLKNIRRRYMNLDSQRAQPEVDAKASAPIPKIDMNALCQRLGTDLIGRESESCRLLLAVLAGQHVVLMGEPGTGKSMLARNISRVLGGTFFQRQLTAFSLPEEVFGPISLSSLRHDKYCVQTNGYLPSAHIAFIDEIFKANSAILNSLLTVMADRMFFNGQLVQNIPLISMIAASNELPQDNNLVALYDRFTFRLDVDPLNDVQFQAAVASKLISARQPTVLEQKAAVTLSIDTLKAIQSAARFVAMDVDMIRLYSSIRSSIDKFMREQGQTDGKSVNPMIQKDEFGSPSDRRLLNAVFVFQISAFVHQQDDREAAVRPVDMLPLIDMLWNNPSQRADIEGLVLDTLKTSPRFTKSDVTSYLFCNQKERERYNAKAN